MLRGPGNGDWETLGLFTITHERRSAAWPQREKGCKGHRQRRHGPAAAGEVARDDHVPSHNTFFIRRLSLRARARSCGNFTGFALTWPRHR
jgi:hypothetical protein